MPKNASIITPTTSGEAAMTANCLFQTSFAAWKDRKAKLNANAVQTARTISATISTFKQQHPRVEPSKDLIEDQIDLMNSKYGFTLSKTIRPIFRRQPSQKAEMPDASIGVHKGFIRESPNQPLIVIFPRDSGIGKKRSILRQASN
jgi:hypothetical protein